MFPKGLNLEHGRLQDNTQTEFNKIRDKYEDIIFNLNFGDETLVNLVRSRSILGWDSITG